MVAGAVYTLSFGVSGSNVYLGQNAVLELVNTNSFSYTGNGEIRLGTEPEAADLILQEIFILSEYIIVFYLRTKYAGTMKQQGGTPNGYNIQSRNSN